MMIANIGTGFVLRNNVRNESRRLQKSDAYNML